MGIVSEVKDRRAPPIALIVMAIIVVSIAAGTGVFFYHFNGDSIDFSNREILTVPTGSMDGEPQDYPISTIPKNSLIMVHDLSEEQKNSLTEGDVITFHQNGIYKVHRIISIPGDGTLVTKGDANQSNDTPIKISDVNGKVVGVAPNVGKAVSFVRDASVGSPLLIIIGVILLIVMICSVIEIVGIIRDQDQKN